ncbi:unnamed protein product [Plutella xylostella]|uniref:(diamondback moth) hypothetical protein n=1 Tax=Plutella xylostella TaxID=51655 RepID=A0A8S4CUD9_PLUXY|nr:unnamed protein product [Plutella xylostella]
MVDDCASERCGGSVGARGRGAGRGRGSELGAPARAAARALRPGWRHWPATRHARHTSRAAGRRAAGPRAPAPLAAAPPGPRSAAGAPMEPPWELELEVRRHIETCACPCDHMGYGNYLDYQVPAGHACLCRALGDPHAHVRPPAPRAPRARPRTACDRACM